MKRMAKAMKGLPIILIGAFAFGSLLIQVNCKSPSSVIPGKGEFLQVHLDEWDTGAVKFSFTNATITSASCEMECEFEDGSKLKAPCQASATLLCPIATYEPNKNDAKVSTNFSAQDISALPHFPPSPAPKKPITGSYQLPNPHPGSEVSYTAIFPKKSLPVRFTIWFQGKPGPTAKITLHK